MPGRGVRVAQQGEAAGQRVVGDAVPHHGAGVDDRPSGVRREQWPTRPRQLAVADGDRALEHALEGEQPVRVTGKRRQHVRGEGADHLGHLVQPPGAEPDHRRLGPDRGDPVVDGVGLERRRLGRAARASPAKNAV